MNHYRLTSLAQSLPATVPFVGPETQERQFGRPFKARLGANENVFGPSPKAIEAMAEADHWMYGDPESFELRGALAAHHGTTPDHIIVGEGIDGLLGYLVRLFVGQSDAVVTSDGAYPTFNYHVAGYGGVLHKVPYRDDYEDPEALFAKAAEVNAKLVYLANPDNPMGSWHSGSSLAAAMDHLPDGSLLVLDEAYIDTAPEGTALPLSWDDPRVIRMRTFSKAYGMAGARVGYAIAAPELITAFHKVRNHFGMNRAAQAGALAALADQEWLAQVKAKIVEARNRISAIAQDNGLVALPSAANFVTIDCGRDGAFAKAVLEGLVARGIFVRMPFVAPQNRCIRISCGTPDQLDLLASELPSVLNHAKIS
ncbi:Histidinol-phosphate aminotransferase [Sulfitobacter noctilucicola]|uniref:Histidinol-phosphate aminotransferase n=1 Tax=Sulfitobacter noctilucicola TaxID=1342301 RepID=A0A7W6MAZ5_9RHOB|nr:pyridoxal phosphate-dependent aminotransferase [Sulfitobacter noctilucicola]KIN63903.1 Histidinol-phosphate aminotransferase [Sulfitobacter noctilucicola]MBB4175263.1 histidinol-phosphate aminotransferase [Sulfitobacter noctilucicola]